MQGCEPPLWGSYGKYLIWADLSPKPYKQRGMLRTFKVPVLSTVQALTFTHFPIISYYPANLD